MFSNDFVDSKIILSDALVRIDDMAYRKGLAKGWYIGAVQRALEKLALRTNFQVLMKDLPMPENFIDDLPTNLFNIQELYAFNSSCCNVADSANIYYKRNFNNQPNGQGYTALNKADQQNPFDPFFGGAWANDFNPLNSPNQQLFANIQNGKIMFSSACSGYSKYRIIYSGMGGDIGDAPLIPRPLRDAVVDFVCYEAFLSLKSREPRIYSSLSQDAYNKLYNKTTGTWWDAMDFVRTADKWVQECFDIYSDRPNS